MTDEQAAQLATIYNYYNIKKDIVYTITSQTVSDGSINFNGSVKFGNTTKNLQYSRSGYSAASYNNTIIDGSDSILVNMYLYYNGRENNYSILTIYPSSNSGKIFISTQFTGSQSDKIEKYKYISYGGTGFLGNYN